MIMKEFFVFYIFKEKLRTLSHRWFFCYVIISFNNYMNLEFFFVALAHLLLLSTFIIILPIFKSSKNGKLKVYRR